MIKYTNETDKFIFEFITDYNENKIIQKKIKSIYENKKFSKNKKEIFEIQNELIKSIEKKIKKLLDDNKKKIEIFDKYITKYTFIYIFLIIASNYKNKEDFINELIQIIIKEEDENINTNDIINFYEMIHLIKKINKNDDENIQIKEIQKIIKHNINEEYIKKNIINQDDENIIMMIITKIIYKINDKKKLYYELEKIDDKNVETHVLTIVKNTKTIINKNLINTFLTKEEFKNGINNDIYNLYEEKFDEEEIEEEKIIKLIQNGIIVPIVEDFLLYNKYSEEYDKKNNKEVNSKMKKSKIEYINNKINIVSNINDINKNKDLFYKPLINKLAILINEMEELNVLRKLKITNMIKNDTNNIVSFVENRKYPYINFKNNILTGFSLYLFEPIDVIRSCSFYDYSNNKLIMDSKENIQIRRGINIINLVGFIYNTKNINCLKQYEVKNIKKTSSDNGFKQLIKKIKINDKGNYYWFFNTKFDKLKISKYDKMNNNIIKQSLYELYDMIKLKIIETIKSKILKIKSLDRKNEMFKIIDFYVNKYRYIIEYGEILNIINDTILKDYLIIKEDEKIAPKEDFLYGIDGKIIKLIDNKFIKKKKTNIVNIDLFDEKKILIVDEMTNKELINIVCQHYITLDKIISLEKYDPNKYSKELYNFLEHYAIENLEQQYICKSCGFSLTEIIKKFVKDGGFDRASKKFISYSIEFKMKLSEMIEYGKYRELIHDLDKKIQIISSIINIIEYSDNTDKSEYLRQSIIKNVIDMLLFNNKKNKLNDYYKKRNVIAHKLYNIQSDLSYIYFFNLDNEIFKISNNEKDFYKLSKQNMTIIYVMLALMIDLNQINVMFLINKERIGCNYKFFSQNYNQIFGNVKIIINNNNDVDEIINYKILCYMIYLFSCYILTYKLWKTSTINLNFKNKTQEFVYNQKIIIMTFIDILNSILEKKTDFVNNDFIYLLFSNKYFSNISNFYSSEDLIKKLDKQYINTEIIQNNNTNSNNLKISINEITNESILYYWKYIKINYPFLSTVRKSKDNYYNFSSNITNCLTTGDYHNWKGNICLKCNIKMEDLKFNKKESEEIIIKQKKLQKSKKINKLNNSIIKIKKAPLIINNSSKTNLEQKFTNESFLKLIEKYLLEKTYEIYNLYYDIYMIDHNIYDKIIDEKIYLSYNENDTHNKIHIKKNHSFFKKDVVYYINKKLNNLEVYYDLYNNSLIGYKEEYKEFVLVSSKKKITIFYSIKNILKNIGFSNQYIQYNKNNIYERQLNIKQIINDFILLINNIHYKLNNKLYSNNNKFDKIIDKYTKKYDSIIIFKNTVYDDLYLFFSSYIDENIYTEAIININDINDKLSNILLSYLIELFITFMDKNENNKVINIHLILDFILFEFNYYNIEINKNLFDVNRFIYFIQKPFLEDENNDNDIKLIINDKNDDNDNEIDYDDENDDELDDMIDYGKEYEEE